jgi:hypothetical protein
LSNEAKIKEEARFWILRLPHENPARSQRELGERVGVSLGAVNYFLKSLVELGFVKFGNFACGQNKLGYPYVLTPSGGIAGALGYCGEGTAGGSVPGA